MARIYTHSVLEAAVCMAKLLDAMKQRYGKVGPARQGQVGHRLAESYIGHLFRTKQETDFEAGAKMWAQLKHQCTAEDEAAIEDSVTAFVLNNSYPWVKSASDLSTEGVTFLSVPDRRVIPADRVHLIDGPVFRVTVDLTWHGEGPASVERMAGTAHLLDWKWHRIIEHVAAPEVNRQLLRYSAALFGPEGEDTVAWLGFPRKDYYEHCVYTPEQRRVAWDDLVVKAIESVERLLARSPLAIDADRCVGPHCRDCDLRRGCDAALRYPYAIAGSEDTSPQEKMTAYMLATLMRSDMAAQLKGVVNDIGPVADEDYEAEICTAEGMTFDRDTIERVCGQHLTREDIDLCFRATKTQTLKILTKRKVKPAVREELLGMMRVTADRKLTTKLKVSKVKHEREAAVAGDGTSPEE